MILLHNNYLLYRKVLYNIQRLLIKILNYLQTSSAEQVDTPRNRYYITRQVCRIIYKFLSRMTSGEQVDSRIRRTKIFSWVLVGDQVSTYTLHALVIAILLEDRWMDGWRSHLSVSLKGRTPLNNFLVWNGDDTFADTLIEL